MAKGSHTSSILTGKDKRCYLTGETRGLEKHHIYFGAGLAADFGTSTDFGFG